MSQITAEAMGHPHDHGHGMPAEALRPENVTLPAGAGAMWSTALLVLGAAGLVVTIAAGLMMEGAARQAMAAYHIGAMTALALSLGAMFWVMSFHLTQAGWSASVRRQFENVMALTPIAALLVLAGLVVELLSQGILFTWMDPEAVANDPLFQGKRGYFYFGESGLPLFFVLRAAVYVAAWTYLARRLYGYSVEQDRTGDKWLSNKARFTSAWGMLVFALSTTFAAFDWLMSLDYRFFSTMWGVYYFAGAAFVSLGLLAIVLAAIRRTGRLEHLATEEHFHDIAKLMFGFTVFWAYIAFSQYFLIWYANIPEETAFMLYRKEHGWEPLSVALVLGHFILPFFVLLWRWVRRSPGILAVVGFWMLLMGILDVYWVVRPMAYPLSAFPEDSVQAGRIWLDIAGIVGVLGIYGGLLVRKVAGGVLAPLHDPRMPEALQHRNYV